MALVSIVHRTHLEKTCRIDAEFYQPTYLESVNKLLNTEHSTLSKLATVGDGNHLTIAERFQDYPGVRYLRGQDLSTEMLIEDRNEVFIPEDVYSKIQRAQINSKDVLVTIVGANTGLVGLAYDIPDKLSASCKLGIARAHSIDPGYLYAFLISKFGQRQIRRNKRGGGQTGLILPDMRNLLIARFPNLEDHISRITYEAHEKIKEAKQLSERAEQLLLSVLGLQDWKPSHTLSYVRTYSQTARARRMDAEHFQPKFDEVERHISDFDPQKLYNLAKQITEPVRLDEREKYRYIEISDVNTSNGEIGYSEREVKDLPPNAKIKVSGGELIVSKVRPTRGAIGIVPDDCQVNGVCSSAFVVLESQSPMREFLQVYLRSIAGKALLEQPCRGTSYPTIDDGDVMNLSIPSIAHETQEKISELISQSRHTRQEAKAKLENAKRAIEIAIEESEEQAMMLVR